MKIDGFASGKRLGPPLINLLETEFQRSTHDPSPYSYKDNGSMLCRFNPSADIFTPNQEESQKITAWTAFKVTRVGTLAPPKTEGQLSACRQVNSFSWIIIGLILFPR